jgi:hypothetical protein
MFTLIFGLLAIASGLVLAYAAGADDRHRADWQAQQVADQYQRAMAAGQSRHPSAR